MRDKYNVVELLMATALGAVIAGMGISLFMNMNDNTEIIIDPERCFYYVTLLGEDNQVVWEIRIKAVEVLTEDQIIDGLQWIIKTIEGHVGWEIELVCEGG